MSNWLKHSEREANFIDHVSEKSVLNESDLVLDFILFFNKEINVKYSIPYGSILSKQMIIITNKYFCHLLNFFQSKSIFMKIIKNIKEMCSHFLTPTNFFLHIIALVIPVSKIHNLNKKCYPKKTEPFRQIFVYWTVIICVLHIL